jgi:hypothetical protein
MHLNRVTSIYLCIFLLFAAGIWVILEIGSAQLTAPPDLNGIWRQSTPQPTSFIPTSFTIAQSGKFLRLAVDNGPKLDLVMANSFDPAHPTMNFAGQGWQVNADGVFPADSLNFTFHPPSSTTAPSSGTYQRQRMGQPNSPPVQSPPRSNSPSPDAVH